MPDFVHSSLRKLITYCEAEQFKGYDPYDAQNSLFRISWLPHALRFAVSQANKRSPINFRPLLGIKRNYHAKAMALFLSGYCNLFKLNEESENLEKASFFLEWLKSNTSRLSRNICWGYDYDYASRQQSVPKGLPTVVHHSYVVQALYKYYLLTRDDELAQLIKRTSNFVLEDVPTHEYGEGICFGYHPDASGCCYNASLHAAECLAIADHLNGKADYFDLTEKAVRYVVSRQRPSGEWYYSHSMNREKEKRQTDFHQGFVLESLGSIGSLTGGRLRELVNPAIRAGLEFNYTRQFDENGQGVYRYPKEYPTDIHNQAQGIITFSKFAHLDPKFEKMAHSILCWTIEHMQDHKYFFYYQKYRHFTNKIPYIRWGQAWMFLAMTEYLLMRHSIHHD
jgi:hypothetical protein